MSDELREIIAAAQSELNPETADNQEAVETPADELPVEDDTVDTVEESDELPVDEEVEEDTEEVTDSDEDAEDESEEEADTDGEKYTVKVDGEVLEVTLDELKNGYQRQADYTRDKQALKANIEEFQAVREEFADQVSALEELDSAWDENPISVLAHFTSNTGNPTQAVAMLIRELAGSNQLDKSFLDMFGITPEIQREWAQEAELTQLRTQSKQTNSRRDEELAQAKMEVDIQKAIAEYDRQIDDILVEEGLELTVKQRADFRKQLATYASDNDLTNLKAAYKAFKYEESKKNKALAAKTVEKAKAKKATNVVSRAGAGEGAPVTDTSDLNAVIRAAMKEASS
jgi:hypothetical protein